MKTFWRFCLIITSSVLFAACAKTAKDAGATTTTVSSVPANAQPLPGTVDKTDTLRVMAYNVLNYGDGCQGNTTDLNGYLKTIIQYAQPDLLSCEKMYAFPTTAGNILNLADNITNNVLNSAFANKYAYATPTNNAAANNMATLFYNKQKLTYVKTETLVANITDFDL